MVLIELFSQLLSEHADEIAPDASDPLHDILEELGEVPDINSLVGEKFVKFCR